MNRRRPGAQADSPSEMLQAVETKPELPREPMPHSNLLTQPAEPSTTHGVAWGRLGSAVLVSLGLTRLACHSESTPLDIARTSSGPAVSDVEPGSPHLATLQSAQATASGSRLGTSALCGVAGVVLTTPQGPGNYAISKAEFERVVNAVRRYATSGLKPGFLVPNTISDGRTGIRVAGVGPNAECGFELGDTVLAIDGIAVTDQAAIERHVSAIKAEARVVLEVVRQGQSMDLSYTVTAR